MEELKDRFYSIQKALVRKRSSETDVKKNNLFKMAYDFQHETRRKQQLERLHRRSEEAVRFCFGDFEKCEILEVNVT